MNRPRLRSGHKNNKGDENNERMRSENKNDDGNSHHGNGLLYYMDFNRIRIMKLIDIPFIDETGTYYIMTDAIEPETGDNVEEEFFVDIVTRWSTSTYYDMPPESRMTYAFVKVKCCSDYLTIEEQSELEEQLTKSIYDRFEDYY